MQGYVTRDALQRITALLAQFPVVAILGPRQCGKSTLAKICIATESHRYLDLENSEDAAKLSYPMQFFAENQDHLICLDEIQEKPEIFKDIKSTVDKQGQRPGQFLILGSAAMTLLRQSSETLAGRIAFLELAPFTLLETGPATQDTLWIRGGFPDSFLATSDLASETWRDNFIKTYLERDIPRLGFSINPKQIERFWRMTAHLHGQLLNRSQLGDALGVSHHTVQNYADMLQHTYMLTVLEPYYENIKKRVVKSPKLYVRDSGILHALLRVNTMNDLLGHPHFGVSWEGFCIEQIRATFPKAQLFFYRSSGGAELDLLMIHGNRRIGVEFKVSTSPKVTRGFYNALEDVQVDEAYVIAPVRDGFPLREGVRVCGIVEFLKHNA